MPEVVRNASVLLEDGDTVAARAVLMDALAAQTPGAGPELLWVLADVEFAEGDLAAGMRCLSKAGRVCGWNAESVSRQIRTLSRNRLRRDALSAVESAPDEVRDNPLVREAIGDFFTARGCRAHAIDGYGQRTGLSPAGKLWRRIAWVTSGGPFTRLRRRVYTWEESRLIPEMRRVRSCFRQLEGIAGLDNRQRLQVRARIDNVNYLYHLRIALYKAAVPWLARLAPVAVLPVWLAFFLILGNARFISGPGGYTWGALLGAGTGLTALALTVTVLAGLAWLGIGGLARVTWRRLVVFCTAVGLFEAAIAEAYDHHGLPATGWWSWIVLGLIAVPALAVGVAAAGLLGGGLAWQNAKAAYHADCPAAVISILLRVLDGLDSPAMQADPASRLKLAVELEDAAELLYRHIVPREYFGYLSSRDWLTQQVTGWGEALRKIQRDILAPNPRGSHRLQATLRHEITCLATGNFGALMWRPSPPRPRRRVVLMHQAAAAIRVLVIAALPLTAVLASQPLLHLSSPVSGWARISAGIWALLYVVISLDPAIGDKIDTARNLAGILRDSEPANRPDNRRS